MSWLVETRPILEAEGWTVEVDADLLPEIVTAGPAAWSLAIGGASAANAGVVDGGPAIDWFGATLGVEVDGERVDVLPAVVRMLQAMPADRDPAKGSDLGYATIPLFDGRVLAVPYAKLRPILSALWRLFAGEELGAGGETRTPLRVSRWQAGLLANLGTESGAPISVEMPDRVASLARALTADHSVPTPLPPCFRADLRSYQQAGLDRMQLLASCGFGMVLADDMGLGKTVQALAHLSVEHANGRLDAPALVIAPTSVLHNWAAEAARFVPEFRVLTWRGHDRVAHRERLTETEIVVTSYPILARDEALLSKLRWSIVIADEAQAIRNPKTAAAAALFGLNRRQTIALTGTPVQNLLADLWSIAHATNPGLLGTAKDFVRRYQTPIEKRGDAVARARLARRMSPFLLRRTKDVVAGELPPKTEIAEMVTLEGDQAALYEAVRLAMQARVQAAIAAKGLDRSRIVVLGALLKLRQACCDPRLVKGFSAGAKSGPAASAKLHRLYELLGTFRAEGRSVLLYSQFTSMLDLIRADLDAGQRSYSWLTGKTRNRAEPERQFQSGETDLFLVSLKAGGEGLNLIAAEVVVLYDLWWNPAAEAQATDRAHRIGQSKPVFVHRLIAENTIEVKILELQARKRALGNALWEVDRAADFKAMTHDDVVTLFA